MSEHTKGKWEIMPWTRRDGDNIRWVKAVRGKRRVAICQTFSPNAEAHARFIAAAPATARHRDKLLAACEGMVKDREEAERIEGIFACQCLAKAPDDIVEPPKSSYCQAKAAIEDK